MDWVYICFFLEWSAPHVHNNTKRDSSETDYCTFLKKMLHNSMSTQDSFDEKYFVRLAEILFLGSEEVLERAVSLVSRIHCLQD